MPCDSSPGGGEGALIFSLRESVRFNDSLFLGGDGLLCFFFKSESNENMK